MINSRCHTTNWYQNLQSLQIQYLLISPIDALFIVLRLVSCSCSLPSSSITCTVSEGGALQQHTAEGSAGPPCKVCNVSQGGGPCNNRQHRVQIIQHFTHQLDLLVSCPSHATLNSSAGPGQASSLVRRQLTSQLDFVADVLQQMISNLSATTLVT